MVRRWWKVIHDHEWLLVLITIVVVLRVPSLFEPYWYGDEGIYLTIGKALRLGVKLYSGIHDNKPPLLYLLAALADGNQFWFRFILLVWNAITICVFGKLAELVSGKSRAAIWSTWIFALFTTLPTFEGNIANAELFFLLPTTLAALVLWKKPASWTRVAIGGILLGCAALFKIPAILEAGVWPVVWLVTKESGKWKKILTLGIFTAIPLLVSMLYFAVQGNLTNYWQAAWQQNIPYLSSWTETGTGGGIFSLKGRVLTLLILLGLIVGGHLTWKRNGLIVGVWSLLTLFAALMSGRPYPHYLLQAAAPLALLLVISKMSRANKGLAVGIVTLFISAFVAFKFYTYPTTAYYVNFGEWIYGKKNFEEYINHFDPNMQQMYRVAQIVGEGSNPQEKIFVWGDKPALYALAKRLPAGRYTAEYHIKYFKGEGETIKALETESPRFIIAYEKEEQLAGLLSLLEQKYYYVGKVGDAKIYRLSDLLVRLRAAKMY